MNMNMQGAECKIRVKSGDLAAPGTGTMGITHMPNGQYWVKVSLPGEGGTSQPLDLTAIERVELVKTKTGWFGQGQWIKPLAVTIVGTLVIPFAVPVGIVAIGKEALLMSDKLAFLLGVSFMGTSYASGVYTGTKLARMARFVVTTQEGKHAVLEGPEPVFRFMSGVYAAPNIQLDAVDSEVPADDSAPAIA